VLAALEKGQAGRGAAGGSITHSDSVTERIGSCPGNQLNASIVLNNPKDIKAIAGGGSHSLAIVPAEEQVLAQ
jgi:hypothetical protein